MQIASHGCGARWQQVGNRTGHCSACHYTFSSLTAFDKHQKIKDGSVDCRHPETVGLVARTDPLGTQVWGAPAGPAWWNEGENK